MPRDLCSCQVMQQCLTHSLSISHFYFCCFSKVQLGLLLPRVGHVRINCRDHLNDLNNSLETGLSGFQFDLEQSATSFCLVFQVLQGSQKTFSVIQCNDETIEQNRESQSPN